MKEEMLVLIRYRLEQAEASIKEIFDEAIQEICYCEGE